MLRFPLNRACSPSSSFFTSVRLSHQRSHSARRAFTSQGTNSHLRPKHVGRTSGKRQNPCLARLGVRAIHAGIDIHGIRSQASPLLNMANSSSSVTKHISVAVVGVGLVGSEFVDQLLALAQPHPFELVSLSTSKINLTAPTGEALKFSEAGWREDLAKSTSKLTAAELLKSLASRVTPGTRAVLIDNTSADSVAALYPDFLRAGVHVITPNKKAFSAGTDLYERILAASLESGSRFLNEATVGAGLPIISTLKDLVATGDKITKIEGVFSGTLSYIFNEFSTGQADGPSFSSVVKTAREKGYTEPHPADDLNGADVARKLTILSRLVPPLRTLLPDGYASVSTSSLVPDELGDTKDGSDFVRRLAEFDDQFAAVRSEAVEEGAVLRFVGVIDVEKKVIKAELARYPVSHPFATSLGGSDNIVMFHTERYGARPLIVQGAGAGAAVTAMGVLGDLLKLV